ncbi:enterobactin synthetase component D [Pseudomonas fluvialis]|uniref:Enterobactin synthase component D n=1 Tax=Pseudomonas fluvialis TaxID=1793966 RepID=A0A7X0BT37_9PSED|nr:4'-phosphopantetheinyl transferase superfamily protein [Pseudomonas fluvialis]MBB6342372.1 enterobactin synthetase component D [Pseudomonas fluvialis]
MHAVEQPANIRQAATKRRAEFLAGRLCARAAIDQLTGRNEIPGIGKHHAPLWPEGLCGSITHSDGYAAALAARRSDWRSLGLDIETLLEEQQAIELAREILTLQERQRLLSQEHAFEVTLAFSLKESLFKALYPLSGTRFYFEHAELLEWQTDGYARLRLLTDLSSEWCRGREFVGRFELKERQLLTLVAIPSEL